MIISGDKKYSKLITVGCSYTTGYLQKEKAQWGEYLAEHLGCTHELHATDASSNYYIHNSLINYCERQLKKDFCVAIQWSEMTRREIWLESLNKYLAFNLATLNLSTNSHISEMRFMERHKEFFSRIFFSTDDVVWRTVNSMISIVSYLRQNNIDFIMFEGINSIMDYDTNDNLNFPISTDFKKNLLDSDEFFTKYGDMHNHMKTHELFNLDNGGHPNSDYIKWWTSEMYEYILSKSSSNNT